MEINNDLIRSLGMTLVHSLWEGLVILVLILFALSLAGRRAVRAVETGLEGREVHQVDVGVVIEVEGAAVCPR